MRLRVIALLVAAGLVAGLAALGQSQPQAMVLNHTRGAECEVRSATWKYTHHTKTSIQIEGTVKGVAACRKGTIKFVLYDQNDAMVKKAGALVDVGAFDYFFRHPKGVTRLTMDYEAQARDW